ncbi:Cytochrome c oxidase subunit 4 [Xylographa vitiligo]|nr:Cytochrome c oxidase subunit 4 [Xylographa vitiligo]
MFLRRSAIALSRLPILPPLASRSFSSSLTRRTLALPQPSPSRTEETDQTHPAGDAGKDPAPTMERGPSKQMTPFEDVKTESDLLPPGGAVGTVPTDIEQATGLERLEILGKMQGVDIFDMKPLDASRKGA